MLIFSLSQLAPLFCRQGYYFFFFFFVCGCFSTLIFLYFLVGFLAYFNNQNLLSIEHICEGFNKFPSVLCWCTVIQYHWQQNLLFFKEWVGISCVCSAMCAPTQYGTLCFTSQQRILGKVGLMPYPRDLQQKIVPGVGVKPLTQCKHRGTSPTYYSRLPCLTCFLWTSYNYVQSTAAWGDDYSFWLLRSEKFIFNCLSYVTGTKYLYCITFAENLYLQFIPGTRFSNKGCVSMSSGNTYKWPIKELQIS